MKIIKATLVFIFVPFFIWTSDNIVVANKIKVETINVQELETNNSQAAIRRQHQQKINDIKKVVNRIFVFQTDNRFQKSKSSVNMNSFKLINQDYQLIKKSSINQCSDPENIRANSYVIKNIVKKEGLDRIKYSHKIYQENEKKCNLVLSVSNYGVSKAIYFNSELYVEVFNKNSDKKELYKLDKNNQLDKIKNTKQGIDSFAKVNEYFFYTNNNNLYTIKSNGQHFLVKNTTNEDIKSINYYKEKLYIVFQNPKNKRTFIRSYDSKLDKIKKLNSLKRLNLKSTNELKFKENSFRNNIEYNVSAQSENLIAFSKQLVCSKDFKKCKYLAVDGDYIVGLANNFVLYASDRIYISEFFVNSKDALMEHTNMAVMSSNHDNSDYLLIKVYNKKGDYQYIEYNLNDF